MDEFAKICQRVIKFAFYALFFLVPLAVTPFNFELFEFNKMLVVYFLTAIILAAWLVRMVAAKKVIFRRSFWDIPLILFLLSQVISYLLSIDRHTSFWGYYSRFNGGLLSVVSYLLLYWAYVSNMDGRKTLCAMRYVLCSAAIVAAYGILEHFGIDAQYWVQDVRNRVFSFLGQPNWLAAWLAALIPLPLALSLKQVSSIKYQGILYTLLFILYTTCLWFTKSRSGIVAAVVALGIFLFLWLFQKKSLTFLLAGLTIVLVIAGLVGGKIFWDRNQITPQKVNEGGSESTDIRQVVWRGAIDLWRHYPLFGTGPETFAYSYYWYRPREHNDLSEWDFLYNKAHNEYLNYAATTGTLGLASYLLLIVSYLVSSIKYQVLSIKYSEKNIPNTSYFILHTALLAGFASIAITNFFGFSVVPVSLLFFLFPAFAVTSDTEHATRNTPEISKTSLSQRLVIGGIFLITGYLLLVTAKYWLADAQFAQAEKLGKSGQYNLAFKAASQAINLRSFEPGYHDELGLDLASLASLAKKENNATLSAQLAKMAVDQSDQALKISPFNLNFWKNRVKIFYRLGEIDGQYYQQALESLRRANKLAPTDPKIKYNLGLLYAQFGQTEIALKTLEEAVALKPNYADVRYTLAVFYEQAGQKEQARQHLEYILSAIDPQNQKIKEMLNQL